MSESSGQGPEMDALRAEVRTAMETRNISTPQAAKQIGLGYSTLQAFMAAKYSGDNWKIAELLRKWLHSLAAAAERRTIVPSATPFVATPTALAFLDVLEHAQFVPDLVIITGGAGVGKTTAAEEHQRRQPNVWLMTAKPSVSSTSAVLDAICEALTVTETVASRRNRALIRRLTGTQGLLIVDEAQHLTTQALDELRSIHDEAKIGLALMGNHEVYARLEGGSRKPQFAQLYSRVGMRIARPRPLAGDVEALLEAAQIEGVDERKLLRTIAAKPGALRGMAKTLRVAGILAASDGDAVTRQHLVDAWARISDTPHPGEQAA
jgi:DNA transposition AAA+ family ATPase